MRRRKTMNITPEVKMKAVMLNRLSFLKLISLYMLLVPSIGYPQSTKVTVSYSADDAVNLPVFVGKETGIFSRNGLDVQLVRIAGTVAVMALIAGEAPISQ